MLLLFVYIVPSACVSFLIIIRMIRSDWQQKTYDIQWDECKIAGAYRRVSRQ